MGSSKITLTDIAKRVSDKTGSGMNLAEGFAHLIVHEIVLALDRGESVKVRELGTFEWKLIRGKPGYGFYQKPTPTGCRLKFRPAERFRKRRTDMEKYGVILDDTKKEAASKKKVRDTCPECGKDLDSGGACPSHGTEPFEPRPAK